MALARSLPGPIAQPGQRRVSLVAALLGVLIADVACLTAARFLTAPLDRFDEGVTLTKAWLLSSGEVPYRDFWATYGPLDSVVLGAAFKVIAPDVLVERMLATGCALAFMAAGFLTLSILQVRGALRWLMAALLALVPLSIPAFNSAVLADLIALLVVCAFARSLAANDWRWAAACGSLLAVASFARPELSAALAVGLTIGGIAHAWTAARWHLLRTTLVSLAIGAAVLWLPVVILAGVRPMVLDLVHYPLVLYPQARAIPLGHGPEGGAALVMAMVFAVVWVWALITLVRRGMAGTRRAVALALLVTGILLFTWVRTRADGAHALTAWPPTCLLLAMLMTDRRRTRRPIRAAEVILSLAAVGSVLLAAVALTVRDMATPSATWNVVPRASIVGARAWMDASDLGQLVRQVDATVLHDRPVFVGLQHNAQVVFNDTTLYFLTQRRPPTPYYEFLPGFTNTAAGELDLICRLDRSHTPLAILGPNTPGEPWNASSRPGSPLLDQWITTHARSTQVIGGYQLVWLRPDPVATDCPGAAP